MATDFRGAGSAPGETSGPRESSQSAPQAGAPFCVRVAKPGDMNLVLSDWKRSCRQHTRDGRTMRSTVFFRYYGDLIDRVLKRPGTVVMVACDHDDPDRLFGWLCVSLDYIAKGLHVVHYGAVKSLYRRAGVFRALCVSVGLNEDSRVAFTFSTRRTHKLAGKCAASEFLPVEQFLMDEEG